MYLDGITPHTSGQVAGALFASSGGCMTPSGSVGLAEQNNSKLRRGGTVRQVWHTEQGRLHPVTGCFIRATTNCAESASLPLHAGIRHMAHSEAYLHTGRRRKDSHEQDRARGTSSRVAVACILAPSPRLTLDLYVTSSWLAGNSPPLNCR